MILYGLTRRIELLEQRLGGNPIVLHLADGSVREIPGTSKHYQRLAAMLDSEEESPLNAELQAIRDAVEITEPAHQFELLRVLLQGAVEEEAESCVPIR